MEFKYKAIPAKVLETYASHGQTASFDESLLNGVLIIEADDEATAEKIRVTLTDVRMWEKI